MITCPSCKREVREGTTRCPSCGRLIPAKAGFYITQKKESTFSASRAVVLAVFGIAGCLILAGLYFYKSDGPGTTIIGRTFGKLKPHSKTTVQGVPHKGSDFDLTIALPGDPLGVAHRDREFLIGNRKDPWGFLRIERSSQEFEVEKMPVTESAYQQKMSFRTIAWNGTHFIAYTDGSWFQSQNKNVFTIHDPNTLKVTAHHPAPDLIGGLAWDGVAYWAATRRNTEDSPEPAYLYRLDQNLEIIDRFDPPAVGCQGLAWDGSYLWFVDVFSDNIYLLNVHGESPTIAHTYNPGFGYLSGITYDGKNIWITEYDEKMLRRLNPALYSKWAGGDFTPAEPTELAEWEEAEPDSEQISDKPAQSSDSYSSKESPPYPEDDATVIEFTAEMRGDTLHGSWRIYFGQDLFRNTAPPDQDVISMPTFARYEISVSSESLQAPVVTSYDASAGENIRSMEELAPQLPPGSYRVSLFIHVQYVDQNGTNRVLNKSIPALQVDLR